MKAIGNFARSSSFQVGVLFTLLLTLGVLFVAYFLYLATEDVFLKESQLALSAELNGLSYVYEYSGESAFASVIAAKQNETNRPFYYAHVKSGELRAYSDITDWQGGENIEMMFASRIGASESDIIWQAIQLFDNSSLLIARDVHDLEVAQWVARTFGTLTIASMLSISGLSLLVGFFVVKTINKIADTTNQIIQSGNFHQRIPVDSSWDDLSKLSIALNGALEALAQKVQSIKSVSDNIAHDLRTPLTRLRGHIECIQDENQKAMLINEVDTILAMFKGLLRIADIEASKHKASFSTHSIDTIINDVIDLYLPLAEDKHQHIQCDLQPVSSFCDRDLVFQALANLSDNAIKFTPEHGQIVFRLSENEGKVCIHICDSGPGVGEQQIPHLTQRFFRADASRHTAGFGLGLALVQAVAKRHGGSIRFTSNTANKNGQASKGLCCELSFPVKAQSTPSSLSRSVR